MLSAKTSSMLARVTVDGRLSKLVRVVDRKNESAEEVLNRGGLSHEEI